MVSVTDTEFCLQFSGSPENVRFALIEICAQLRTIGVPDDAVGTAELVVGEVLNNIVEHAMADQPDGLIDVACTDGRDGQLFTIIDDGIEMPGGKLPAGIPPEVDTELEDLPEGGWGWSLVHTLTRDIAYQRVEERNCVKFLLPKVA
jgi:serine/threonine-protein kinase RsbW